MCNISAQDDLSVNIAVALPKVKAVDNKNNLRNVIQSELEESLLNNRDYVTLVEREYLYLIERRRKQLKNSDNANVASSAMVGANYLLESKVSDIKITLDSTYVVKTVSGKKKKYYVFRRMISFDLDLELIDIESGEVKFQHRISPTGWESDKQDYAKLLDKDHLLKVAVIDIRDCLDPVLSYMLYMSGIVKSQVIDVNEVKKDKAKKLLVKGGAYSPARKGIKYSILKVYQQEVAGDVINREEKIGEAKIDEVFYHYIQCKVSNGEKEVLTAFNEGARLYLVPTDIKSMDNCNQFLGTQQRRTKTKAYKAITTTEEKKGKSITIYKAPDKKKSTKKVERKKGG